MNIRINEGRNVLRCPFIEEFKKWSGEQTTHPLLYIIDFTDISSSSRIGLSEKIIGLHSQGHSLRSVFLKLGIGKTTVLDELKRNNIPTDIKSNRQRGLHSGATPCGYVLIKGQLVADPKEQEVIQ